MAQARQSVGEAVPIYRNLWKANPELYADTFMASLLLKVLTLPQEEEETRCALLIEAFKVARSEEFKRTIMAVNVMQGAPCKLHNLMLK